MKHLVEGNFSLPRPRILVCVDLDSSLIYGKMKFIEGTKIVGTTDLKPMARTVFQIVSPQDCPSECKVTYGSPVQFKLASEAVSDEPMYMASDFINTAGGSNRLSGHRQVFLSANRCAYNTHWKLEHMYPQLRMEMEGRPIYVSILSVSLFKFYNGQK
ncbi:unnamed protein product [Schistocephalus solidus]|uniref:DUF1618 domain-containing protein n=1 Tax=Schistocephalus solidus TaxID=70667 RepID=A0A183SWA0_SCHSO|nr:unnamed protein product [Schistocephalus solidus]